jgi:hypothetical protein
VVIFVGEEEEVMPLSSLGPSAASQTTELMEEIPGSAVREIGSGGIRIEIDNLNLHRRSSLI